MNFPDRKPDPIGFAEVIWCIVLGVLCLVLWWFLK